MPGRWLRILLIAQIAVALRPAAYCAAGVGGLLELNYGRGKDQTRNASGGEAETRSAFFSQRYRLDCNTRFFPNVSLSAGGTFERADGESDANGVESDFTASRIKPYATLDLQTPLLSAGVSYYLDENWANSNGVSSPRIVREQYSGRVGYRPDGFPMLNLQVGRQELHDTHRERLDTVNDSLIITSTYNPTRQLRLSYAGNFGRATDRLNNTESRSAQNGGTVSYSNNYWQNRVEIGGTYTISGLNAQFQAGGSNGEILTPLSPFAGLAALSNTPGQVVLLTNSALIDGNTAAPSGIDIGFVTPPGDARPRNMGLEFSLSAGMNVLYVWVDKRLSPEVVRAFSWDVYTSGNNSDWVFLQTVSPAPFAPFDNRFEIRFQNVVSRFVKVVTRPLATLPPPTPEFPDPDVFRSVQVTEIQAFLAKPAATAASDFSSISQTLNLGARVRILDVPSLTYRINFFASDVSDSPLRYAVSNALNANHRFNEVFSGSAGVVMDYSDDPAGHVESYTYSASLQAVPLPTLTHAFSYSGRTASAGGIRVNNHSLYLNNGAELYRGVNAGLGGGISFSSSSEGERSRNANLSASLGLTPHRTLSVNMGFGASASESSRPAQPTSSVRSQNAGVGVSYTPVPTVYLYGDWSYSFQAGSPRNQTLTVSAGWSPFPQGTLQFNLPYTETHHSTDSSVVRRFGPSVRWNITRRASLTGSYTWDKAETNFEETRIDAYNVNLRIAF